MTGLSKQRINRRGFDDPPRIHDRDAIDELRNHAHIVGDEQNRHVEPVAEVAQQSEDLDLDGDVERRGRFVGDENLRPAGERDRDHNALALAAHNWCG